MTFTGRIVRQGNTNRFGVGGPGGFTRAASPLGGTLYVFLATGIVEITDLANGSGTLTNYQGIPGSSDIGGAFEYNNTLYLTVRGATDSLRSLDVSTGATTHVADLSREIGACATDGTTVWAYESSSNKLFSLNPTDGSLTELGDVTFPSGTTENGVQGMFYWAEEGRLYIIGGNTDRLYRLPAFADNPTTWLAEAVDDTITSWGVTQAGVAGATVFNGEAYMIGGNPDALYRFERVLPLSIEAIDEQFILLGTEDYDLIIDITGNPDTVEATGHMEGFSQDWDAANAQLHIKAEEVTRLIAGVFWTITVTRGTETLTARIAYNVVRAAPIFETLLALHLYRDVPIYIDILIANIPNLIVPDAQLIGLKSELQDYGMNIQGKLPAGANFTKNDGDLSFIVPSETGGVSEMHDYAYEIESGNPPAIVDPTFERRGDYVELSFADVNHALGYEWTLEAGDDAVWNFFNDTRNAINPRDIEVTPGNLNVTIKFPNVASASSYEYSLESETHNVVWTRFSGTLDSNMMITTIIPNLRDGVTYTLRLRVASPWVGPPTAIQVTGGRLCYALGTTSQIYIFHTGHAEGTQATRIKRLTLPTSLNEPDHGGLAVNSDGDVFIINADDGLGNEKALYVFEAATIDAAADESTLTEDRKHPFPAAASNSTGVLQCNGMAEYQNELYIYTRTSGSTWRRVNIVPIPSTDGATLTRRTGITPHRTGTQWGMSVTDELVWYRYRVGVTFEARSADRTQFTGTNEGPAVQFYNSAGTSRVSLGQGLKVIGNTFYSADNGTFQVFRINPEVHETRYILDFQFTLPVGTSTTRFLDILV